jgi:hypothetical protein
VGWCEVYRSEFRHLSEWEEKPYGSFYRSGEDRFGTWRRDMNKTWRELFHEDCLSERLCRHTFPRSRINKSEFMCWADFYNDLRSYWRSEDYDYSGDVYRNLSFDEEIDFDYFCEVCNATICDSDSCW